MLSRRSLEVGTAVLVGAFGAAIAISSLYNGVSWTRAGVGPGTFPFLAGVMIVAGSVYNLIRGALDAGPPMLGWPETKKLASLFLPAAGFVAAIPLLGMHAAAGAYVFATLALQQRQPVLRSALIALATTAAIYLIFDWALLVPMPRGILGKALGY